MRHGIAGRVRKARRVPLDPEAIEQVEVCIDVERIREGLIGAVFRPAGSA
jgi:hypothetical protein